jgi:hypothetical protein
VPIAIAEESGVRIATFRSSRERQNAARAAGITRGQHQALLAIKGFTGAHPISMVIWPSA